MSINTLIRDGSHQSICQSRHQDIRTTSYICDYCSKRYVRQNAFQHHTLMCRLSRQDSKSYQERVDKDALLAVPTQQQLYQLIIDLNSKYERLQSDYHELKRYVDNRRRKIDILEWLNENCSIPENVTASDLFFNISLIDKDVERVFELDYIKGVADIIIRFINDRYPDSKAECPLRGFMQKDGVLYVYEVVTSEEIETRKWQIMTNDLFERFIRVINHRLMILFRDWHRARQTTMDEDRFSEMYIKHLKTVTGGNFKDSEKTGRIRNLVYRSIRENLKSMIVYDFG